MASLNGRYPHIKDRIDYLKTPNGWWVPDFYEFTDEDDKTAVEHISIYLSQLDFASKEDYMRI